MSGIIVLLKYFTGSVVFGERISFVVTEFIVIPTIGPGTQTFCAEVALCPIEIIGNYFAIITKRPGNK